MSMAQEVTVEKWPPLLEYSTNEVFEMMLGSKIERGEPAPIEGVEFTAMVGLAGCVCGLLSVRCCQQSALQIASAMLGLPAQDAAEHAWDALGEIANMVAGNFKNKIDGMSDKCLLSVPTVVTGADYSFRSLADADPIELWFRFQGRPLRITLELHS